MGDRRPIAAGEIQHDGEPEPRIDGVGVLFQGALEHGDGVVDAPGPAEKLAGKIEQLAVPARHARLGDGVAERGLGRAPARLFQGLDAFPVVDAQGAAGVCVAGPAAGAQDGQLGGPDGLVPPFAAGGDDADQPPGAVDQGAAAVAGLAVGGVVQAGQRLAFGRRQDDPSRRVDADALPAHVDAHRIHLGAGVRRCHLQGRAAVQPLGPEQHQVARIIGGNHAGAADGPAGRENVRPRGVGHHVAVGHQKPGPDQHGAGHGVERRDPEDPPARRANRLRRLAAVLFRFCRRPTGQQAEQAAHGEGRRHAVPEHSRHPMPSASTTRRSLAPRGAPRQWRRMPPGRPTKTATPCRGGTFAF